jgi:hypothetical protein
VLHVWEALVTGIKGPLEEGWQNKVTAFADRIMSTCESGPIDSAANVAN